MPQRDHGGGDRNRKTTQFSIPYRYLEKEKGRYKERITNGTRKLIGQLSQRDQRQRRRNWKHDKRKSRKICKSNEATAAPILTTTPPTSPPVEALGVVDQPAGSSSKKRGRKKVRKDKAKAYRQVEKLKVALYTKTKENNKYRQRLTRMRCKMRAQNCNTPRSKADAQLKQIRGKVPTRVKRTLVFHNALIADLKESYHKRKTEREKQLFAKVVCGRIMKRYRQLSMAKRILGNSCSKKRINANKTRSDRLNYERKASKKRISQGLEKRITDFFNRDDVSQITSGKKETVTRKKEKKQKRFLLDSMRNLHDKFVSENQDFKIGYDAFRRRRPFWVVVPSINQRDTCLCKLCDNLELKACVLQRNGILKSNSLAAAAKDLCCEEEKECMYRTCNKCNTRKLADSTTVEIDMGKQVTWPEWRVVKEERKRGTDTVFEVTITKKVEESGSLQVLKDEFTSVLRDKGCRHLYNIRHQYRAIRAMKETLHDTEAALHIDFAENYGCKLNREVQAMHFGASKGQVTIHNGVLYTHDRTVSFATISDSTRHDPCAVWSYLCPVLGWLQDMVPQISLLHFISDGPATQYKCRKNFYLYSHKVFELLPSLTRTTWNFLEAGHGKGAADGVGGFLKRTADEIVAHGRFYLIYYQFKAKETN